MEPVSPQFRDGAFRRFHVVVNPDPAFLGVTIPYPGATPAQVEQQIGAATRLALSAPEAERAGALAHVWKPPLAFSWHPARPVRTLGARITAWRVEDIRELIRRCSPAGESGAESDA